MAGTRNRRVVEIYIQGSWLSDDWYMDILNMLETKNPGAKRIAMYVK
jgi:hypothetical protein